MIKKIISSLFYLFRILFKDSKKAKVHILNSTDLLGECAQTRIEMQKVHSEQLIDRVFQKAEWYRWSYLLKMIEISGNFLDVGIGHGNFINSIVKAFPKKQIVGFDITKHKYLINPHGFHFVIAGGQAIPFPDKSFDCVTCLEVIEHLEPAMMMDVLSEIRRVTRKQIIITVPYDELDPIFKGHKQKFTLDRLESIFPGANFDILVKTRLLSSYHWMVIEKRVL